MNGAVKHYIEADGAYYFTPSSNKLSPLFFSGTDQYATQLEYLKIKQGATTGPSVIYDIDLESHTETREQIIRPVLDVAPVGCVWISSYKDPTLRGTYSDVSIAVQVKNKESVWELKDKKSFYDPSISRGRY